MKLLSQMAHVGRVKPSVAKCNLPRVNMQMRKCTYGKEKSQQISQVTFLLSDSKLITLKNILLIQNWKIINE
jgi:hypothetical protein